MVAEKVVRIAYVSITARIAAFTAFTPIFATRADLYALLWIKSEFFDLMYILAKNRYGKRHKNHGFLWNLSKILKF